MLHFVRSLLPFIWLFEDRTIHITATRIRKVREPLLEMEIHGEQNAATLPIHSVTQYALHTLDFIVLTSVALKIGPWVKTISPILFHHTTWSGL